MTEQETSVLTPVTISVDIDALVKSSNFGAIYYGDDSESGGSLAEMVAFQIASKLAPEMNKAVTKLVSEQATAKVDALIDDVLNGEIRPTNGFGEPTGDPVTLRTKLVDAVKEQLNRKVNDRGEASGYYSDNKTTYVDFVAKRAAKEALDGELREAAQEAVAGLKDKVALIVSDQIAEKISREVRR